MRIIAGLRRHLDALNAVIRRHGGGVHGLGAVMTRSLRIARAAGLKGLLQRARLAGLAATAKAPPPTEVHFQPPAPIERVDLRVGVMVHMFYPDLADEFASQLAAMPMPYTLLVSVVDEQAKDLVVRKFRELPHLAALQVRVVPNRGRDLAPFMVTFRDEILALDVVCHVHTKKSLYTGSEQGAWRRYLVSSLFGSRQRVAWILGTFAANPRLGIVYPESHTAVPLWAHTWLSNKDMGRDLARRLGLATECDTYIDFTAGSMFWARVDALRPLYNLGLTLADFPEETRQTDGTLHHALERLLVQAARHEDLLAGILPADGQLALSTEGGRNWEHYFRIPIAAQMLISAVDADVVSLDVFDTLVVRTFLTPAGARAYLAHRVEQSFGLKDFLAIRERAEALSREEHGCDVDLATIYRRMANMTECRGFPLDRIRELELAVEMRCLLPRQSVIDAATQLVGNGKRLVAISDMYLDKDLLAHVLPASARALPKQWYVSCETGWRKDDGEAWLQLPKLEGTPPHRWLHVGDNEHSDIQKPLDLGFLMPTHVLRPSALYDVVPSLRTLRPTAGSRTAWQDQLWLGLLANRFAELADRSPASFSNSLLIADPDSLGYLVVGPLLTDYLAWLSRLARARDLERVLFLSREGYLLEKGFALLKASCPCLASIDGVYLLASRRGVGTPALRSLSDLEFLLGNTFNGTLFDLLEARFGSAIAAAAARRLGKQTMSARIFLPEMKSFVVGQLEPIADEVLRIAAQEREAYLQYWNACAGPGLVADLGYAGSIQAHLSRMTGATLGGAYFATRPGIEQVRTHEGWAAARYHDAGSATDTSAILGNDLFLEAVMTAPEGQFSHFEIRHGQPVPAFLEQTQDQEMLDVIARIQDGALTFVNDVCRVVGTDACDLNFDTALVQEPLRCLAADRWRAGEWMSRLAMSDTFTGRGEVRAGPAGKQGA